MQKHDFFFIPSMNIGTLHRITIVTSIPIKKT